MNRFDTVMSTIRPEDWRSTIIQGFTSDEGVILPEYLQLDIPTIIPAGWHANGKTLPKFREFIWQMVPHVLVSPHLAAISPHMVFIATDVSFGIVPSTIAGMACFLVWNPLRDRLFFCGQAVETPPISQYIDLANPIWELQ